MPDMNPGSGDSRLSYIDAARGTAMLFVFVAHFAWIYRDMNPEFAFGATLETVMKVASPTFVVISGFLLGHIFHVRGGQLGAFGTKLVDRGLFLLTVGHAVIWLAYLAYADGPAGALRFGQITDAIGLAIVVGPLLVTRLRAGQRLVLAAALFIGSWLAILLVEPQSPVAMWLKDTLVGAESGRRSWWRYNFPLLPWLALYIAATVAGEFVAARSARAERNRPVRNGAVPALFGLAAAALATALGVGLLIHLLASLAPAGGRLAAALPALALQTAPYQKLPPGFAYFAVQGGLGLALLALLRVIEQRGWLTAGLALLATLGRNSLIAFLIQEHVYVSWLFMTNWPYTRLWPVVLLITILVNVGITLIWNRYRGLNRLFTVGYGRSWGPVAGPPARSDS